MTKKDYMKIAKVIADLPVDEDAKVITAAKFAEMLAEDNPRFDRNQFRLAALGEVKGNV